MVWRPDSLQTAPNLHDRMWELDGFGDYMKHSFHFQFIVLRRGITFTQMARNLEMHSFCETQNVHWRKKNHFKDRIYTVFFFLQKEMCLFAFLYFLKWASAAAAAFLLLRWSWSMLLAVFKPHGHRLTTCFMGGYRDPAKTIMMSIMVGSL